MNSQRMSLHSEPGHCGCQHSALVSRRERSVLLATGLTAGMMVVEVIVGYVSGSMALLADGWHMATHVGALGLSSLAYWVSRRYAGHQSFTFGTGKIHALAGYTSAVALAFVAIAMSIESVKRLLTPEAVDYARSLPVAVLGLGVNLSTVMVLHDRDASTAGHHGSPGHSTHAHHHDHNHRAALLHVVADTLTSGLAIVALLTGRYVGWLWLDPITGIVGALVIVKWGFDLAWHAARELVDMVPSPSLRDEIRQTLENMGDVRVHDVRVWPVGGGSQSCVVKLRAKTPRAPDVYRAELGRFGLAHLAVEVHTE